MRSELMEFELDDASRHLVDIALTDIALLHADKAYHNPYHTMSVMRWAYALAGYYDLDQRRRSLIVVSASFHDYVHDGQPDDEVASAEYLQHHMDSTHDFSDEETAWCGQMILGTIMEKTDAGLVQRAATSQDLGTRILADADLSGLGSDYHILQVANETLLRERCPSASPRGREMLEMLGVTLQLLEAEPLTEAARTMLPHRKTNHAAVTELRRDIAEELARAA